MHMVVQDSTEREAETALVTLMNYEKFDLIKLLLRNQLTIVWCTRLANAQDDDEKMRIEVSPAQQSWWSQTPCISS